MLLPWCRAKTSMNSSGQLPVVLAAVDAVPLCLGLLVYFAPRRTEKQRNSHWICQQSREKCGFLEYSWQAMNRTGYVSLPFTEAKTAFPTLWTAKPWRVYWDSERGLADGKSRRKGEDSGATGAAQVRGDGRENLLSLTKQKLIEGSTWLSCSKSRAFSAWQRRFSLLPVFSLLRL